MKMKALNEFTKAVKTRTGRSETSSSPATPPLLIGHGYARDTAEKGANLIAALQARQRYFRLMVRLAGIEPTTLGFGGQYSIH